MSRINFNNLEAYLNQEIAVSDWLELSQERIVQFADVTLDHQWIHIDEARAKRESPFGTTVAHGFLTLSLLSSFLGEARLFPEGVTVINYGLDKVRFLAPVKQGSLIRNRTVLLLIESKGEGRLLFKTRNTVEIQNQETPALIAESLALVLIA